MSYFKSFLNKDQGFRVTGDGGFALFVDYGHDGERQELSLRAYRKHALVDPLASPGHNDITADVNFGYLKSLIEDRVNVYGPVQQRYLAFIDTPSSESLVLGYFWLNLEFSQEWNIS